MKRDVALSLALLFGGCALSSCSQTELSTKAETSPATQPVAVSTSTPEPSPLAQPEQPIQLIEAGEGFHGDQIKARSGQKWLGLYANAQGSQLILSKLKIELVEDAITDLDIPGQKTGKSVFVDRKEEPIFLVRNAPMLKAGKAVTIFSTKKYEGHILFDRQPMKLKLGDLEYELVMRGDVPSVQPDIVPAINPRLVLRQGNNEQVVFHLTRGDEDSGWQLYWAGDVDGDGKLDFYADLTGHYNASHRKLFLSSQAEPGQLVKEVAEFVTTGC